MSVRGARIRLRLARLAMLGLLLLAVVIAVGYRNATATPRVRHLSVQLPGYPQGEPPLRLVFLSDIHVHGPDMPPSRVGAIVAQVNALHPDVVILGGDFIGNNWIGRDYSVEASVQPLALLKPKLGAWAVLGNNDHRAQASKVARALSAIGVRVLDNQAVRIGPLAVGGLDDRADKTYAEVKRNEALTFDALRIVAGARILLAHGPDEFPAVPDDIRLMLTGHTHCGQIVLPLFGPLATGSDFGRRYVCGVYRDGNRLLVVSGGVGTSHIPLRFGAPPDLWLITID